MFYYKWNNLREKLPVCPFWDVIMEQHSIAANINDSDFRDCSLLLPSSWNLLNNCIFAWYCISSSHDSAEATTSLFDNHIPVSCVLYIAIVGFRQVQIFILSICSNFLSQSSYCLWLIDPCFCQFLLPF